MFDDYDNPMRTTLDIDADVLEAAKTISRSSHKTTGEVVSELLRKALQPPLRPAGIRNGVPVYACEPGAMPLGLERINELRDELAE